jgi:tyrosyl-tRNA synthetase
MLEFMQDTGKKFTINEMLKKEAVKLRLDRESPMSFLEFSYQLFQAYDFVHLFKEFGASFQIEGSDQWGNIVAGIEYGRKLGIDLYGITNPIITDANGKKFGKSAGNAVWLSERNTPNFEYYQFWRNAKDAEVPKLLRIFTDLPISEIEKLEKLEGAEINEAKKILAFEATKICRGYDAAVSAEATAKETFENGGIGRELPVISFVENEGILSAIVRAGLATSNSDARRAIAGGAVSLNGIKITDEKSIVSFDGIETVLSFGKKSKVVIKK